MSPAGNTIVDDQLTDDVFRILRTICDDFGHLAAAAPRAQAIGRAAAGAAIMAGRAAHALIGCMIGGAEPQDRA